MCHRLTILAITAFLGIIGCDASFDSESLMGEWVAVDEDSYCVPFDCGYHSALVVQRDSMRFIGRFGWYEWNPYRMEDDFLFVTHYAWPPLGAPGMYDARLRVVKPDPDRLILKLDDSSFSRLMYTQELEYKRARRGCEPVGLTRIAMSQGYCFYDCPEFDVELDESGHLYYMGREMVERIGVFKSEEAQDIFSRLHDLVSCYPIEDLLSPSLDSVSHPVGISLLLWFGDEVIPFRGHVEDFGGMHLLIHWLSEAHQYVYLAPVDKEIEFVARRYLFTGSLEQDGT